MKLTNLNFTTAVQAVLALMVVGMMCWLAGHDSLGYKDAFQQIVMVVFGFWMGSSRSSQAKDDKSAQPTQEK